MESTLTTFEEVRAYARRLEALLAEHRAAFLMGYGQHGEKALEELEQKALARAGLDTTPDSCANCGAGSPLLYWNPTGGWSCFSCGESDYPEAAE